MNSLLCFGHDCECFADNRQGPCEGGLREERMNSATESFFDSSCRRVVITCDPSLSEREKAEG
jgi:hypothetical protein